VVQSFDPFFKAVKSRTGSLKRKHKKGPGSKGKARYEGKDEDEEGAEDLRRDQFMMERPRPTRLRSNSVDSIYIRARPTLSDEGVRRPANRQSSAEEMTKMEARARRGGVSLLPPPRKRRVTPPKGDSGDEIREKIPMESRSPFEWVEEGKEVYRGELAAAESPISALSSRKSGDSSRSDVLDMNEDSSFKDLVRFLLTISPCKWKNTGC
jgi:hypothetical protein